MITNFESITPELNEYELSLVGIIISGLKARTAENPIKSDNIVKSMSANGYKISGVRLRKIINFIRTNALLPIIGTSKGYYVSYEKIDIQNQIKSLNERANSIIDCANGLKEFLYN